MTDRQNAKLFVGRLPEGCTAKDLEDLFKTYGTVNQTDLIGKYGFVHMIKREEAEEAIKKLNNYNFMGSQLTVQFSTSKLNNTSGKVRNNANRGRGNPRRNSGPFRNNSYQQTRDPQYNRFANPPPVPPNNFGPYYEDMNPYYREPYYPESEPFYRQNNPNINSVPQFEAPNYGRGGPPPAPEYSRPAPAPIQSDMYGRGDGLHNRPLAYDFNRPMPTTEPPRSMGFGAPVRNGYGNTGYANRVLTGAGHRAGVAPPPPPPSARWQPY